MIYPFPKAEYRQFQRTFFAGAKVIVRYDKVDFKSLKSNIFEYTHDCFGIETEDKSIEFSRFEVKDDDKLTAFKFEENYIEIFINGKYYVNFEYSLRPLLDKVNDFFSVVLNQTHIKSVEIEKRDKWVIKSQEPVDLYDVAQTILNPDLLPSNSDLNKSDTIINGWDQGRSWQLDNAKSVSLRYSLKCEEPNVAIVELRTSARKESIDVNELKSSATSLNSDLYNIFMYCITENVIAAMTNND